MGTGHGLEIGIFVFDEADELAVTGPFEVLAAWPEHSALKPHLSVFSRDGTGVRLARGMRILPDRSADDVDALHVLLYPGGPGIRTLQADPDHLHRLRTVRERISLIAGVGTGALGLAAAGLLAGRPATTHPRRSRRATR